MQHRWPCENQLVMVLPDVLGPGLRVVFCGTAAGSASARRGAYYSGPGNKFWAMLYEVELTPRQLRPADFASALEYGIGLTDLCKLRSGSDLEIGDNAFDVAGLETRLLTVAPRVIAFNGIKAGREALGSVDGYGRQTRNFADAEAWVLPSTSGAANRWWDPAPWQQLADHLR
jgi:double-stranded uracil-DNA glycosylase